jgi:quercetin dioxygenase-like cupin family protein
MSLSHALSAVGRRVIRTALERGPDGSTVEEIEWLAGPGWTGLPLHRHDGDERYEILSGQVRVEVEGSRRTYRAGESVIVRAGRSHTLRPVDGHGTHIRVQCWSPPLPPGALRPAPHEP